MRAEQLSVRLGPGCRPVREPVAHNDGLRRQHATGLQLRGKRIQAFSEKQEFWPTVGEQLTNFPRCQAKIDGHEYRTDFRRSEKDLNKLAAIINKACDPVPRADAAGAERVGQLATVRIELGVGLPFATVDKRRFIRTAASLDRQLRSDQGFYLQGFGDAFDRE